MKNWFVALGGVLGYFALIFLYTLGAYLLVRSPPWFRYLFGFSSLSIFFGLLARTFHWASVAHIVLAESILIGGGTLFSLFWAFFFEKEAGSGRGSAAFSGRTAGKVRQSGDVSSCRGR